MILLSPGGAGVERHAAPSDRLAVASADGIWFLRRAADGDFSLERKEFAGTFVSALARTRDGALIAATHGFGLARSEDEGKTWRWINRGLSQFDVWVVKALEIGGREVLLAGGMPAHLFISENGGAEWRELPALRAVPSLPAWFFPPPPHLGHVKDIVVRGGSTLFVAIEVGALLRSEDEGASFSEIAVFPEISDRDIHRVLLHKARPARFIVATGWGLRVSEDDGATWLTLEPAGINYPDALVCHPDDPDLVFVAGSPGYPPNWFAINRSRSRIARSRDGGKTWERLRTGLPSGGRPTFGAMTLAAWPGGYAVYAGDTDGQIFESRDGGESWEIIFETGPVSKGEHYRGLAKGRAPMTDLDELVFGGPGAHRVATTKA